MCVCFVHVCLFCACVFVVCMRVFVLLPFLCLFVCAFVVSFLVSSGMFVLVFAAINNIFHYFFLAGEITDLRVFLSPSECAFGTYSFSFIDNYCFLLCVFFFFVPACAHLLLHAIS